MSISGSEILKVIASPFRIYNLLQLDVDTFIFSLSFQAFENCNITTAKKILHLAVKQDKLKRVNNTIIVQFDPWALEIPINWSPDFKGLEKVPEAELSPLPETPPLEIKPISFEIREVETLTEPFQYDKDLLETLKAEEKQKKKEPKTSQEEMKPKKAKEKGKKIKEEPKKKGIKQKKLGESTKKIKKPEKETKKKKTLFDYMKK
ncbi:MAG: DUF2240 family protein [Promethearchaeota archaeon]